MTRECQYAFCRPFHFTAENVIYFAAAFIMDKLLQNIFRLIQFPLEKCLLAKCKNQKFSGNIFDSITMQTPSQVLVQRLKKVLGESWSRYAIKSRNGSRMQTDRGDEFLQPINDRGDEFLRREVQTYLNIDNGNWTEQGFRINSIKENPIPFHETKDYNDGFIQGTFKEKQLQKIEKPETFNIPNSEM